MIPVVSRNVKVDASGLLKRYISVAPILAQRISSIIYPTSTLLQNHYYLLKGTQHSVKYLKQYLTDVGLFHLLINSDCLSKTLRSKFKKFTNERFGPNTVQSKRINVGNFENLFNEHSYIDEHLFKELCQHFQNLRDVGIVSYKLEGKLKNLEQFLVTGNFSGDPVTQALKAKLYLELLFLEDQCSNAAKEEASSTKKEELDEEKEESDKKTEQNASNLIKKATHAIKSQDGIQARDENSKSLAETIKPDLFEQKVINNFSRDKGILTEQKIDLSYENLYKKKKIKDRTGDMTIEVNKKLTLKGVSKNQIAHPLFAVNHVQKKLLKKEYYVTDTDRERAVFILIDVSGSMKSYGKLAIRNGLIMDRFAAVQKGRCRLFLEGYLLGTEKMLQEIKTPEDLTRWIHLNPNGGDTNVGMAVKQLINTEKFKQFTDKGLKGEIILVNDGQDDMPSFHAPENVIIHAMQLADVTSDTKEEEYYNQQLVDIAKKNNGKFVFINAYKHQ